jgi:ferredoxin
MFIVSIDEEKCQGCGECCDSCPASLLSLEDGKAVVSGDASECMGCETCTSTCEHDAVTIAEY